MRDSWYEQNTEELRTDGDILFIFVDVPRATAALLSVDAIVVCWQGSTVNVERSLIGQNKTSMHYDSVA